jgi:urease accessory protein
MIGISNMGLLDEKPLQPAASTLAVLDSKTRCVPIFFEDERKLELTSTRPSDSDLQRSDGIGRIVLDGSERRARIIDVYQKSPVRIMFPKVPDGDIQEAVLVNTGGGIAGGDRLEYEVAAVQNASIAVSSQAAEKVYGALDEPARITTRLKVSEAAKLAWLPQETILFNTARICRNTEIDASFGAEVLAVEWIVLGRSAYGEQMVSGQITDSWRVKKDGRLIWADSFRCVDETYPHLHKKALLSRCKAIGTLVYFGRDLDDRLELIRDIAPSRECCSGATLVNGVMIVRFAAEAAFDLRLALQRVLQQFRQDSGPGPFRVPKMWSC